MTNAEDRFLFWSKVIIIVTLVLYFGGAAGLGYWMYQNYTWVTNDLDDGLSAFEGAELVAARQALGAAAACQGDGHYTRSALKVTDVEPTGEPFGAPRTAGFRAKVQAYGIFGPTREIAVWIEDNRIHPQNFQDCRAPDW